jgi:hypothetical protein
MKTILTCAAAAVLACGAMAVPAHAQQTTSAPARRARPERNRIRLEEIQRSTATTVYQLIQASRGMWLMRNQPTDLNGTHQDQLLVFMDGAQLDGVDDLRQVALAGVRMVEFLTPSETEHRLGKYSTIGAIRVVTRDEPADAAQPANHR